MIPQNYSVSGGFPTVDTIDRHISYTIDSAVSPEELFTFEDGGPVLPKYSLYRGIDGNFSAKCFRASGTIRSAPSNLNYQLNTWDAIELSLECSAGEATFTYNKYLGNNHWFLFFVDLDGPFTGNYDFAGITGPQPYLDLMDADSATMTFPVSAGTHKFTWVYEHNPGSSNNSYIHLYNINIPTPTGLWDDWNYLEYLRMPTGMITYNSIDPGYRITESWTPVDLKEINEDIPETIIDSSWGNWQVYNPSLGRTGFFAFGEHSTLGDGIDLNTNHWQVLEMEVTLKAGNITFDYYVSCEGGYDYFIFLVNHPYRFDGKYSNYDSINDIDIDLPTVKFKASGNLGWNSFSYPVSAGNYNLQWVYFKDDVDGAFSDFVGIDNLKLPTEYLVNKSGTGGSLYYNTNLKTQVITAKDEDGELAFKHVTTGQIEYLELVSTDIPSNGEYVNMTLDPYGEYGLFKGAKLTFNKPPNIGDLGVFGIVWYSWDGSDPIPPKITAASGDPNSVYVSMYDLSNNPWDVSNGNIDYSFDVTSQVGSIFGHPCTGFYTDNFKGMSSFLIWCGWSAQELNQDGAIRIPVPAKNSYEYLTNFDYDQFKSMVTVTVNGLPITDFSVDLQVGNAYGDSEILLWCGYSVTNGWWPVGNFELTITNDIHNPFFGTVTEDAYGNGTNLIEHTEVGVLENNAQMQMYSGTILEVPVPLPVELFGMVNLQYTSLGSNAVSAYRMDTIYSGVHYGGASNAMWPESGIILTDNSYYNHVSSAKWCFNMGGYENDFNTFMTINNGITFTKSKLSSNRVSTSFFRVVFYGVGMSYLGYMDYMNDLTYEITKTGVKFMQINIVWNPSANDDFTFTFSAI